MNTIGENLRAARKAAGLTIREVAAKVHAGESQISTWETGRVKPTLPALQRYVDAGLLTPSQALCIEDVPAKDAA